MQNKNENNSVFNETNTQQMEYEYNFINTPWDDRGQKSKIFVVGLLCAIFATTMGIVINNFIVFYKGFQTLHLYNNREIKCNLVRVDKYRYAARLHSIESQELICVGALIGPSSVLANALCLNSGPIRLYLGSPSNHQCRKGYSVEVAETILHDGVVNKHLAVLTTSQRMIDCGDVIRLDFTSNLKHPAFIIGRPFRGGRTLSFQLARLTLLDNLTMGMRVSINNLNKHNLICAKHLSRCPVRAGDLLVQRGRLIGIASTSTHREKNEMACFANLSAVQDELKELDIEIDVN